VADIVFNSISKVYPGGTRAVDSLSLSVADGEFMVLVGPSGCGKTTALRMVAGLEEISEGELIIGGKVVNNVLPKNRDIAMVFQNYALYPHMSVAQNMGFALKVAGLPKAEINQRVSEAAKTLQLTEYLDRKPKALSGGQRQRVAMGRAIVRNPQAFLMDEPLSNLDAQLRVEMRTEIARIQRLLGVATIYVTHDQVEAMTMGDRVAVMRGGILQQVATPQALYDFPANEFVAGFIGAPPMNLVSGVLVGSGDARSVTIGQQAVTLNASYGSSHQLDGVDTVIVGIRPEDMRVVGPGEAAHGASLRTTVERREALGSEILLHLSFGADAEVSSQLVDADTGAIKKRAARLIARVGPRVEVAVGDHVDVALDLDRLHLFDATSGLTLRRQGA
jgi:ABC-type sugar transport system ATPase subunit